MRDDKSNRVSFKKINLWKLNSCHKIVKSTSHQESSSLSMGKVRVFPQESFLSHISIQQIIIEVSPQKNVSVKKFDQSFIQILEHSNEWPMNVCFSMLLTQEYQDTYWWGAQPVPPDKPVSPHYLDYKLSCNLVEWMFAQIAMIRIPSSSQSSLTFEMFGLILFW